MGAWSTNERHRRSSNCCAHSIDGYRATGLYRRRQQCKSLDDTAGFAPRGGASENAGFRESFGTLMNNSATLVMTTVDSEELARTLASRLLERRLAACVQEVRINSHYRWDGELRYEPEILLLVKTSAEAASAAMRLIEDRSEERRVGHG